MVKDFTKEDIPVLGRLVSISEDNTIANAELIWDAKKGLSIQDTVDDINNSIVLLGEQGGLTGRQRNILKFFEETTNLYNYEYSDGYDDAYDVSYSWLRFALANWLFDAADISFDNRSYIFIDSIFDNHTGTSQALFVRAREQNQYTDNDPNAPYAIKAIGACKFDGNVFIENDLISFGDIRTQEGTIEAWEGVFQDSITSRNINGGQVTCDDLVASNTISVASLEDIIIQSNNINMLQALDNADQVDVWECNVEIIQDVYNPDGYLAVDFMGHTEEEARAYSNLSKTLKLVAYATDGDERKIYCDFILTFTMTTPTFVNINVNPWASDRLLLTYVRIPTSVYPKQKIYSLDIPTGGSALAGIEIQAPLRRDENRLGLWLDSAGLTLRDNCLSLTNTYLLLPLTKQDLLVSGENIKTINGESILGSGNISVTGGGGNGNVVDNNYVHTDNNFTNAEKSKLAGIAAGAEINVLADWTESDTESDAYILHKPEYLASFSTLVNALATDGHFVTQNDIITVGGITAQDIENWNRKADASTKLSGYNIVYDQAVFEEDENDVFTLNAQYKADHPVRMTSGDNQWTTAGDNKVPTVAAVYDKFLTKDDSTVVKTTGNLTIGGTKTFSSKPVVSGIMAPAGTSRSANKVFTTDGYIQLVKTINNQSIFSSGNNDTNINISYSNFTAPSQNTAGIAGLVPAPAAGTQDYILSATGWKNMQTIVDAVAAQIQSGETWILSNISIRDRVYQDYDYAMCVTNTKDNKKYLITSGGDQRGYPICGKLTQYGVTWTQDAPTKKDEYTSNYYPEDMITDFNLDGILSYNAFSYLITG